MTDSDRGSLERQFSLVNGERRDDNTWEYDLIDLSAALVISLVEHDDVADTHYIDRDTGHIAPDAPIGTVRLQGRRFSAVVHSVLFDWFLLFWASSIVVSGVWLASDPNAGA